MGFYENIAFLACNYLKCLEQEKEANLDIIMDRMRQDAAEGTLKESLRKALTMLDKIKDGYATTILSTRN